MSVAIVRPKNASSVSSHALMFLDIARKGYGVPLMPNPLVAQAHLFGSLFSYRSRPWWRRRPGPNASD